MTEGLRQRKKARTRRLIANAALARFARDGFDATSVQQISDDAEVAVSTFYGYFPSKEATAFPDDDTRANQDRRRHSQRCPRERAPHRLLRAASLNLANTIKPTAATCCAGSRSSPTSPLWARMPHDGRQRAERFTALLAARLHVDPLVDLRRLAVATAMAAVSAASAAWLNNYDADLVELVDQPHDALDAGLAHLF